MATNKDILDAQRFNKRRLISAFNSGAPGGRELEPKSMMGPLIAGTIITIVILVGAWITGRFAPALPADWGNGYYVIDKDTGARYFSINDTLHPVRNTTSARLLSPDANLKQVTVGASALKSIERGPEIGIVGAPDSIPDKTALHNLGWVACPIDDAVNLTIGVRPDIPTAPHGALVETGSATFFITEGHRHEIASEDVNKVKVALGWESVPIVPVPDMWINLFEQGAPLAPLTVPEAGKPVETLAGALAQAHVGTLITVKDPDRDDPRVYVVNPDETLTLLTGFDRRMYEINSEHNPDDEILASIADIASVSVTDTRIGDETWPQTVPEAVMDNNIPCSALVTIDDHTQTLVLASTGPTAPGIHVEGGTGALVGSSSGGSLVAVNLITDAGKSYGIAGQREQTLAHLGYTLDDVIHVPATWVKLVPEGPVLSIDDAWASVPQDQ
ncbi:MAG: type VII secretion protein EccB [Actinomycetaceae bacterium]|nr:type VII secretion protein EccB [Actinomycetaceae bacterium]